MKNTASVIDASVKDPIKTEKDVICALKTFTTVYRVKIENYSQLKHSYDLVINCGTFHLAGYEWTVDYFPRLFYFTNEVGLRIRLCTNINTSLKLDIQINLIDPSGRCLVVAKKKRTYYWRNDGEPITIMRKTKLESSKYINDDCFSFECIVTVTKWSHEPKYSEEEVSFW
ncbi:MATH domain-containing protein [Carex littledalei]|uniref:MATH domain-containing protein n=1 Tax=Carex littledalei TaxID=544730 RepID=A0A833RMF8_9POAL|nr:MATH domain-containing protein [Carex littledalei]